MPRGADEQGFLAGLNLEMFALLAFMLALAPGYPEPHLVEKVRMLFQGSLHQPIDLFDLVMHASGLVILVAVWIARLISTRHDETK